MAATASKLAAEPALAKRCQPQRSAPGHTDRQLGCRTSSPLRNSTSDGSGALHAAGFFGRFASE